MMINPEDLSHNNPIYSKYLKTHRFLEVSFEGEECVKEHALEMNLLTVPSAMLSGGVSPERASVFVYSEAMREANCYISRARYPEVCGHQVVMASGRAFSREPEVTGDTVRPILDTVFADGSDFETGVTNILTSYLKFGGGGLLVNLNANGLPVIYHYPVNGLVNWAHTDGALRLVVLEDDADNDSPFNHEKVTQRVVMGLDDDTGHLFAETWRFERYTDDKGNSTGHDWSLVDERAHVTRHLKAATSIPFYAIGGWRYKQPIFLPLARTAKAYLGASAEYAHSMWWAATPQPYINFGEGGGWFGADDFDAATVGNDMSGGGEVDPVEIRWGASSPWLLRSGDAGFISAPTGSFSAQEKRLENLKEEMAGLGARAFKTTTRAGLTAETERLLQSHEGSVMHTAMRDVAKAITLAVRDVAEWRKIADAETFNFRFNSALHFAPLTLGDISFLAGLHQDGYIGRTEVRGQLRKAEIIAREKTDDALDKEIMEESPLGGGFGDDEFDPLNPDDELGLIPDDE
ncbi:MAG: DUF4055 domain-containing protein [Henriciella sp.]